MVSSKGEKAAVSDVKETAGMSPRYPKFVDPRSARAKNRLAQSYNSSDIVECEGPADGMNSNSHASGVVNLCFQVQGQDIKSGMYNVERNTMETKSNARSAPRMPVKPDRVKFTTIQPTGSQLKRHMVKQQSPSANRKSEVRTSFNPKSDTLHTSIQKSKVRHREFLVREKNLELFKTNQLLSEKLLNIHKFGSKNYI